MTRRRLVISGGVGGGVLTLLLLCLTVVVPPVRALVNSFPILFPRPASIPHSSMVANHVRMAFSPLLSASSTTAATTTSLAASPEHVKKAGGGIPLVPPGDCRLFDPSQEGRLGGTDDLWVRLEHGPAFRQSSSSSSMPTTASSVRTAIGTTTSSFNAAAGGTIPTSVTNIQQWLRESGLSTMSNSN